MRRWIVVAVVLGCGKTTSPAAPTPDASVVVVAPVEAEAPRPRVFVVPPGTDAELATIAASICRAGYRVEDGKKIVGCRKPPPFDRRGRGPDGAFPEHTGDPTTFCAFAVLHRGRLTRDAATDQIALRFDACHEEGETWDAGFPGSVVVVEPRGGSYEVAAVALDVNTNRCWPIQAGGPTLICQSGFAAGTLGGMTYFFTLSFFQAPYARTFARLYDNAALYTCAAHATEPKLAPEGLVDLDVDQPRFSGIEDGETLMTVAVDRARAAPSAALEARLRTLCGKGGAATEALPPKQRFQLEFAGFGVPVRVLPKTQKLLDAWEKETPDLTQLRSQSPP